MCGEYCLGVIQLNIYLGSPPHTWRIQVIGQLTTGTQRITSTYVENTDQVFKLISAMNGITSTYVENTRQPKKHQHVN